MPRLLTALVQQSRSQNKDVEIQSMWRAYRAEEKAKQAPPGLHSKVGGLRGWSDGEEPNDRPAQDAERAENARRKREAQSAAAAAGNGWGHEGYSRLYAHTLSPIGASAEDTTGRDRTKRRRMSFEDSLSSSSSESDGLPPSREDRTDKKKAKKKTTKKKKLKKKKLKKKKSKKTKVKKSERETSDSRKRSKSVD